MFDLHWNFDLSVKETTNPVLGTGGLAEAPDVEKRYDNLATRPHAEGFTHRVQRLVQYVTSAAQRGARDCGVVSQFKTRRRAFLETLCDTLLNAPPLENLGGLGVSGVELHCLCHELRRLELFALAIVHERQDLVGLGEVLVEIQSTLERPSRVVVVVFEIVDIPQSEVSVVLVLDLQRLTEGARSGRALAAVEELETEPHPGQGEIGAHLGVFRVEAQCLLEALDRLVVEALLIKLDTPVVECEDLRRSGSTRLLAKDERHHHGAGETQPRSRPVSDVGGLRSPPD